MTENILNIFLHNQQIGTLTLLAGDQIIFSFDDNYINNSKRFTLSLSFKSAYGSLVTDVKTTRTRLMPFFSNLLPEGIMRNYLSKKAGVNEKREFFLLNVLGHDLPGAITIHRYDTSNDPLKKQENKKLSDEETNGTLHFSLAGIQLKFPAMLEKAGGLTIPANGIGGSWIVKLPSTSFESVPENEFKMMCLASLVGINVPECKLLPVSNISGIPNDIRVMKGNAFAIKRFDRKKNGLLVHIEDFAQVFGLYPEKKYEKATYRNIAEVLLAESSQADIAEFVRRLVFNTLIGNADMHLKNWSLIYNDRVHPELSPAYDFLSTIPYIKDINTALKLVKSRDMAGLSYERLSQFAAKARLSQKLVCDVAKETVGQFMEIWRKGEYLEDLPFLKDIINEHLKTIRIVKKLVSP